MAVLAVTGAGFALVLAGVEVLLPLWTTGTLGLSAAQWAQLRSLRFTGTLVGVIILGAFSDRFGNRLLGSLAMFATAGVLALFGLAGEAALWPAMPIMGAMMSTGAINLNTLTQEVSRRRQGLANSIYRSIGALASVLAPIAGTTLAVWWRGYPPVLLAAAATMALAGLAVLAYPGEPPPQPLAGLRAELSLLWQLYRDALRQKPLMRFLHLVLLWNNVQVGVGAFAAIRFARQLGQSDAWFGGLSALCGVVTLATIMASGFILDRVPLRLLHGVVAIIASAGAIVMGASDSLYLSAAGLLINAPLMGMIFGPTSMWVSRAAVGCSQSAAFSVHKVLSAVYLTAALAIVGTLEATLGIRTLILIGGILGVATGSLLFFLPEPPRPITAPQRPPAP